MRSVDARVRRLERFERSRPPRPCPSCGAPRDYIAGFQVQDPSGNPMHEEHCGACGIAVWAGRAVCPVPPGGYRDVLVLPAGSPPLPV